MTYKHMKKPCSRCPWRKDVEPGEFPVCKYRELAATAYDGSIVQFACHKSTEGKDAACAGFLLRGAEHNFGTRLACMNGYDPTTVTDGGCDLHADYREMAIYQGVDSDDECLEPCRSIDD